MDITTDGPGSATIPDTLSITLVANDAVQPMITYSNGYGATPDSNATYVDPFVSAQITVVQWGADAQGTYHPTGSYNYSIPQISQSLIEVDQSTTPRNLQVVSSTISFSGAGIVFSANCSTGPSGADGICAASSYDAPSAIFSTGGVGTVSLSSSDMSWTLGSFNYSPPVVYAPVPLPASFGLLLSGLGGIALMQTRRGSARAVRT
jgi:hypothetical protein